MVLILLLKVLTNYDIFVVTDEFQVLKNSLQSLKHTPYMKLDAFKHIVYDSEGNENYSATINLGCNDNDSTTTNLRYITYCMRLGHAAFLIFWVNNVTI